MTLILDNNSAKFQIKAYKPGCVQVNETTYHESVIVLPDQVLEGWPPHTLAELTCDHLLVFKTLKPAILLLGTGAKLEFPPLEVYGDLINLGIGVEIMDTHAACRTYNVLTAENRFVAAALIIN